MKAPRPLGRIFSRTGREIIATALLAAVITVVASDLPKIDLLESAINDDNFTDLVLQTRGELPIDTTIRVVTYDEAILDTFDMVDRAALAMQLAALLELKPRVVGVDFLIETERPEAAEGDAMLAALAADHPNLLFGVFYEDSLKRFRLPPARFKLPERQLGCINIQPGEDNTIRTYRPVWGEDGAKQFESFDVKIARAIDSSAVDYLLSFGGEEFTIDYAAGIGEVQRQGAAGDQIFPVMPLATIFGIVTSGDTAGLRALREQFAGKAVLVGYADIRTGQVTSVVDRFYTPFKPEKNTLPDMHGVAIHANIVNTILERRVLENVPMWANILWSAAMVALLLAGRERLERVGNPTRHTVLSYAGFIALLILAALLPVLAFRYTPYKLSIFMPIGSLLLAVPTFEGLAKAIDLWLDVRRRGRLKRSAPGIMRADMSWILKAWSPDERMERAVHFLHRQFHMAAAALFDEAIAGRGPMFTQQTIGAPTLARVLDGVAGAESAMSPRARAAAALLRLLAADAEIARTLQLSRSLYIALNEIRRQSRDTAVLAPGAEATVDRNVEGYADLALKTLAGRSGDEERFDTLYGAIERYAAAAVPVLAEAPTPPLPAETEQLPPFVFACRCAHHDATEQFVYFGVQEDADSTDDLFDLVYIGATLRCQPTEHVGLGRFKEMVGRNDPG